MGLWNRTVLLFRTRGRAALEKAEDPRQIMGYVDEQQQELLRQVKQGLVEVAISKHQLQRQVSTLEARASHLRSSSPFLGYETPANPLPEVSTARCARC